MYTTPSIVMAVFGSGPLSTLPEAIPTRPWRQAATMERSASIPR